MFRPEGITLDLGSGPATYVAFERSGSMPQLNVVLAFPFLVVPEQHQIVIRDDDLA